MNIRLPVLVGLALWVGCSSVDDVPGIDATDAPNDTEATVERDYGFDALPEFLNACAATSCSDAVTVTTAQEFLELVKAQPWVDMGQGSYVGPVDGICWPVSGDIHVVGTIEVDAATVPKTCGITRCYQDVHFVADAVGTSCSGTCQTVRIKDATVRIRKVALNAQAQGIDPSIQLLPACAEPCANGSFRCEANDTCWTGARSMCEFCLGGARVVCACWTAAGGFAPDGAACTYDMTDVPDEGTCQWGRCVTAYP
jgi:hypothetical protein